MGKKQPTTISGRCEVSYSPSHKLYQALFYTDKEPHIVAYSKFAASWDAFTTVAFWAGARGMPKKEELPATIKANVLA